MPTTPKQILILGKGPEAAGLVATLAKLPGIKSVRQQAEYQTYDELPRADLCIEMLEGIATAYAAAQQALKQGMGLVISSPAMAAMHGNVLHAAARGQGAFFAIAAHGAGLAPLQLQAIAAERLILLPDSAPQTVLRRMTERGESFAGATAELNRRFANLSDMAGKETHTRAHSLFAAWRGQWLNIAHTQRQTFDALEPWHLKVANHMGLQLVFGADITQNGIRTGLMALPPEAPQPQTGTETLLATSAYGTHAFAFPTASGTPSAILGAVQRGLSGPMQHNHAVQLNAPAYAPPVQHLLLLGNNAHRRAFAHYGAVLAEDSVAQGCAALVQPQPSAEPLPSGTLAIALPFAPTATPSRLRLVG